LYGTYVPDPEPFREGQARLIRRSGLADCLSVFGSKGTIDANGADPAVLAALGIPPGGIQMLVETRRKTPLDMGKLGGLNPYLGSGAGLLRTDGNSMWTIRATASVRLANGQLSEVRRSVAARVKFMPKDWDTWIDILRWYDTVWSN
jgi:general secretion pathway protein K